MASELLKGIASGVVAGALGSGAMDVYWGIVHNVPGARPEQKPRAGDKAQNDEPSTQEIADAVSKALTGHKVRRDRKAAAGVAVHYAFGAFWGGVFGALAGLTRWAGLPAGLLYAAGIWLFGDEIALRALGVAPDPRKVPVSEHLQALGAHLVYGIALWLVTRMALGKRS